MKEKWKPYLPKNGSPLLVSSFGRVVSEGDVIRPVTSGGILQIRYYDKDKKRRAFAVHKAVAETFLENSEGHFFVLHLDGDKKNNFVENLIWANKPRSISRGKVLDINRARKIRNLLKEGLPAHMIAEQFGVSKSMVSKIKAGVSWN